MSTDSFLLGFRRFVYRSVLYSDNVKTFKRANCELKKWWMRIDDNEVKNEFASKGIVWKFIVERSPLWGDLKDALCKVTFLAHRVPDANLSLVTDALDTAEAAVYQQEVNGLRQPLSFFPRSLTRSRRKYSTYDKDFLAIYLGVKYFKYILEGRPFIIFPDHKPLTFAFQQELVKANP
ncbi:retrovirus-related Pol polyprotein from transposon 412 [Nephila pilipes]|uniref:Retrovirus-related Pol polyprotein from transposon 412 n=1 Tax=Nephila pilipes TaxID=299642 RepID=A0A8X6ILN9_NEPPI|nr:retrovirus-related Pol polyprotein from transposon 412 [Nephila pilipes]